MQSLRRVSKGHVKGFSYMTEFGPAVTTPVSLWVWPLWVVRMEAIVLPAPSHRSLMSPVDSMPASTRSFARFFIRIWCPAPSITMPLRVRYLTAYTLVHGAPMLSAFTREALADPKVRALADKVSMATYREYAEVVVASPARIVVTLIDGRTVDRAKYYPTGSQQMPMTTAQVEEKFMACATTVFRPAEASKLLDKLRDLGKQSSAAGVWPLLSRA